MTTDPDATTHDVLRRCFQKYTVILEPDRDEAEWWAGAPSVVRRGDGRFCLAARMRGTDQPRGRRGYEIRLMESDNAASFSTVGSIRAGQVPAPPCIERPALAIDPHTGRLRLYVCGPAEQDSGLWGIFLFDEVDDLDALDLDSIRLVLPPSPAGRKYEQRLGFKDPFVFHAGGQWHMVVIGYDLVERTYHFVSADGRAWASDPANPVLDNGGWHNFFIRPTCVMAAPLGDQLR